MPKYWSLKTLLVTFPPSGTGVTESLARDRAPFTRITPVGTFDPGWTTSEKSPPFLGAFCGLSPCAQAGEVTERARAIKEHKNRKRILIPRTRVAFDQRPGELGCESIFEIGKSWRDTLMSRQDSPKSYSERRKSNISCCCVVERSKNCSSTKVASLLLLAWSWMAVIRFEVRPSCSRKIRCPSPHKGAVRNWSPPALPCETLSAKPVPMLWISISENAFTGALPNDEVKPDACVVPGVGL